MGRVVNRKINQFGIREELCIYQLQYLMPYPLESRLLSTNLQLVYCNIGQM